MENPQILDIGDDSHSRPILTTSVQTATAERRLQPQRIALSANRQTRTDQQPFPGVQAAAGDLSTFRPTPRRRR
jgi:hypothetical protein